MEISFKQIEIHVFKFEIVKLSWVITQFCNVLYMPGVNILYIIQILGGHWTIKLGRQNGRLFYLIGIIGAAV